MLQKNTITQAKRQHFKSILTQSLDDLLSEEEKNTHGLHGLNYYKDAKGDYTDRASLDTDSSLSLRLRERACRLAEKIESTLKKIEDGVFGICEECGRPISEKRLMARPIARLCIQCKEKDGMAERIWE
jgi:DnaK suppressor protein